MDRYTAVFDESTTWSDANPRWTGENLTALHVLEHLDFVPEQSLRREIRSLTDATGGGVSIPGIIRTARNLADDDTGNRELWDRLMVRALSDAVLDIPGREQPLRDEVWVLAGRWWADRVGQIPDRTICDHLHAAFAEGAGPRPLEQFRSAAADFLLSRLYEPLGPRPELERKPVSPSDHAPLPGERAISRTAPPPGSAGSVKGR